MTIATLAIMLTVPTVSRQWHNRLTRADFLYDFDYMIAALEANFPSFGIIYRQHGVNMLDIAQDLRDRLECGSTRVDFELFWNMLRDDFFYFASPGDGRLPIGHLYLLADWERKWIISGFGDGPFWGRTSYYVDILNTAPSHRSYPALQAHTHPHVRLPCWQPDRVLSASIIERGSIGYLRVYTLSRGPDADELEILNSLHNEIADFEHLIIDIRGNNGGWRHNFERYVTRYFICRAHRYQFHYFIMDGAHNMSFLQTTARFRTITQRTVRDNCLSIECGDFLFLGGDISCCVIEDISKTNYHYIYSRVVPAMSEHSRSLFGGKIWLLVDENVYSDAMVVAAIHKDIGFATLVGETTGGGAAPSFGSNFIALPNTGIIIRYDPALVTDRYGRPLEYGIEPHYFNRPGMCALETVLAMISEGV